MLDFISTQLGQFTSSGSKTIFTVKVTEDDITFKLAFFFLKWFPFNDNTGFCSIMQASKWVLGLYWQKNNFFVQFWLKKCCTLPDGQLWEWLTGGVALSQPKCNCLPCGLGVKRLMTHALCSPAYSDIAWYKHFSILTMKGLYCRFFACKTQYSVLND